MTTSVVSSSRARAKPAIASSTRRYTRSKNGASLLHARPEEVVEAVGFHDHRHEEVPPRALQEVLDRGEPPFEHHLDLGHHAVERLVGDPGVDVDAVVEALERRQQ